MATHLKWKNRIPRQIKTRVIEVLCFDGYDANNLRDGCKFRRCETIVKFIGNSQ